MKHDQIEILERQGCYCEDWSRVSISDNKNLHKIRNVIFKGDVSVGSNVEIVNVPGGIANIRIGDNVRIINVSRIECTPNATFGIGTDINVLDETGSRPVRIYPGISAQVATLAARVPEYASSKLFSMIDEHIAQMPDMPEIGDNAEIIDCGVIINVRIWPGVKVEGALKLKNGSIVNNSRNGKPFAYVGYGVDAENFIIEDGVVDGGCQLRNSYVGQGTVLDKHFTAHDSLFFANCSMENGEACAVLAGPYTVSMHKSSLLIGAQTSFMNAGSGTNMSNHKYKLGPVHWGVLERGVKMASNAYVMHGSRIGAYSLLMGDHKTHPDSSMFPFSYLFGDTRGNTTIIPAAMLKSYGLKRDEDKWPIRDRREGHGIPFHDRITFPIFNPHTAESILKAIDITRKLVTITPGEDIDHNGLKLTKKHLLSGVKLYEYALSKYLNDKAFREIDNTNPGVDISENAENSDYNNGNEDWIDLGGQVLPSSVVRNAMQAPSIAELEKILDNAAKDYDMLEKKWIEKRLRRWMQNSGIDADFTSQFHDIIEKDRIASIDDLESEQSLLNLL